MAYLYWIHTTNQKDPKTQGYIGVTTKIKERFWDHKKQANNGTHPNPHLANAIKKYKETIQHTILFTGPLEGCYQLEEYFRLSENIGWNLAKGGSNSSRMEGKTHSKEARLAMSKAHKGVKKSEEHKKKISAANKGKKGFPGKENPRARAVICIETGQVFATVKEAAEFIQRNSTAILANIAKRTKHSGGYTWKYYEKENNGN